MSLPLTHSLCALLLALSLIGNAPAKASLRSQTTDEAALRTLAERFFNTWAAKDPDGFLRLWSAQAPERAAREKATRELFNSSSKIEVSQLLVRKVQVEGAQASLRIALTAVVTDAKTGQPRAGYGKLLRTLSCVKESDGWKAWRELSTADDFAATLAAAPTAPERAALLAQEPELQNTELQRALLRQGGRLSQQQKFEQAIELYQFAQTLAEKLGDRTGSALAWRNIGFAYATQEKYRPALEYFEKTLALLDALSRPAQAEHWRNLAVIQRGLGDYLTALDSTQRAIAIFEELQNKEDTAGALINLAVIYRALGEYDQALAAYQQTRRLLANQNDTPQLRQLYQNLGVVYALRGDYSRALENFQRALTSYEAAPQRNPADIAEILHNIGNVYLEQSNPRQALAFYQRAQADIQTSGKKSVLGLNYHQIGRAYEDLGDEAAALTHYRQAQTLFEAIENKPGLAGSFLASGNLELQRRNFAPARALFQKSLNVYEALGDSYGNANALANLALVQHESGAYEQALALVERATPLAEKTGSLNQLAELYQLTGRVQLARGQDALARQAFEKAIAATEALRAQVAGGEQDRQRLLETRLTPWQGMVQLLVKQNDPPAALGFAEQARARVLLDVLQHGRAHLNKALRPAEQKQEHTLKTEVRALNLQLTRATQADKPEAARVSELKTRLDKARLSYEAFQTALYATRPELRTQRGEAPLIKAEELASLLPTPASALLEYVVTADATYLFTVTPAATKRAEVRVFTLPVKRAELAQQIDSFRRQLAGRDLGFRQAAARLYELLLKPAQAQLKGKTNLIIVPDGKLWELPFQALLSAPQRFLLEDAALSYAPSLTVLREMARRRPAKSAGATLLAFGNPALEQATQERAALTLRGGKLAALPEAEEEVKALGRLYGAARSRVYTGVAAREDRAKAEATQARVLHFATHGVLNDAAPLYSHLVLAPGEQNEDGLLEAWELLQLDLHADLAVLSACETARGRVGAGEGVIGLTWALFVAGVPSTVVSQWKVESAATRELMLSFHRALNPSSNVNQTTAKSEALRQAALKLLRKPVTSHPFYWAGFVLMGDGR